MEKYEKLEKLGEGAHGVVTKARVKRKEEIAAERREHRRRQAEEEAAALGVAPVASAAAAAASAVDTQTSTPKKRKIVDVDLVAEGEDEDAAQMDDEIQLPTKPDTIVAIKKIRLRSVSEGLSMEAVREIKLLQELNHPHVLKLLDIFAHHSNINLVLEYMVGDLEQLIRGCFTQKRPLAPQDIKAYMRMVLQGMEHCHKNWIVHRDMKPGNILIGGDGGLKIADFGLAKVYGSPDRRMSPQACTIWYRAPELLFGATSYGAACDMWSIGCIMGEMFWMKPMFAGVETEVAQLTRIFSVLGTPSVTDWPNVNLLSSYIHFKPQAGRPMQEIFPALSEDATDLLAGLLTLNPLKRLTATEALAHRYFKTQPLATPLTQLPKVAEINAAVKKNKAEAEAASAAAAHVGKASGRTLPF